VGEAKLTPQLPAIPWRHAWAAVRRGALDLGRIIPECADIGFPDGTLRTVARARIRRLVDRFVRRPRVEVFVTTNAVAPARSETVPSGPSRHAVVSTKIDTHRLTW
jgi:hypothetical protein